MAYSLSSPPDASNFGAESTAPAAGTVLADTGVLLAVGSYYIEASLGTDDVTNMVEIALRNAANNADVAVAATDVPGTPVAFWFTTTAANQRIVIRNRNAGVAGKHYRATIQAWFIVR